MAFRGLTLLTLLLAGPSPASPDGVAAGRPPSDTPAGSTADTAGIVRVPVEPLRRADRAREPGFSVEAAPFRLRVPGHRVFAYRVAAVTVLPGEPLELAMDGGRDGYTLRTGSGSAVATPEGWRWRAPGEPGSYALEVEGPTGTIHVNVFVLRPRSAMQGEYLDGYRIGAYRVSTAQPQPRGFVAAGPDDEDILVSPHFTLGQLLCKQPGSPRYVVLSVPLILKLEAILARVVEEGHDARTLHVMSGFRTPWYNRAIGNTTTLSRHLYGEAADIFVDADGDGYMDDLNGDGRRDVADARLLFDWVEAVEAESRPGLPRILVGGMKAYRKNQVRGPFLHVDVRGRAARW